MKKIRLITGLLLLSSCSYHANQRVSFQNYNVIIKKPLMVYNGWARAFIQQGRNINKADIDRYQPYCTVEMKQLARNSSYEISAGRFNVVNIYSDYGDYALFRTRGINRYPRHLDDDYGPFELRSVVEVSPANDIGLLQVNCIKWSSDGYDHHLSFDDMNQIMSALVSITPNIATTSITAIENDTDVIEQP